MRRWLRIIIIAVIVVATPIVLYTVSLEPGLSVARFFINLHGGMEPPPHFNELTRAVTVTKDVSIEADDAPPAQLDIYRSRPAGEPRPVILWIHGGGFIGSSKEDTRVYATLLAHEGYVVASLGFTPPPEARYPVPVRQANAALRYLRQHAGQYGGDSSRIFIAGNSAGAQIASQVGAVETNPSLASAMQLRPALAPERLRGVILSCGSYDMDSLRGVRSPFMRISWWAYTGYRDWMKFPDVDQLSTIHHVTDAYPPVFLTVGDGDPLQAQSFTFEAALRRHAVPVTTLYWQGSNLNLPHDYQFEFERPQAQEAFRQTLSFLDKWSKEVKNE